jgi:hypothetical protein
MRAEKILEPIVLSARHVICSTPSGMRTLAAVLLTLSLLVGVSYAASAEEPPCAGYVEHLREARTQLERGDRAGAVAALRRAKEALHACGQEGSSERGSMPHAHSDQPVLS